jgi:hypothetical protein
MRALAGLIVRGILSSTLRRLHSQLSGCTPRGIVPGGAATLPCWSGSGRLGRLPSLLSVTFRSRLGSGWVGQGGSA